MKRRSLCFLLGSLFLMSVLSFYMGCTPPQRRSRTSSTTPKETPQYPKDDDGASSHSETAPRGGNSGVSVPPSKGSKDELKPETLFAKCNPAVFTIRTSAGQGSGFFINENGLAVTNHHVLKGSTNATIYMANGKQYRVREIRYSDKGQDYAIFTVDLSGSVPYLSLFKGKPKIGEKVYAIGSPQGLENTFTSGIVSQLRGDYQIQIDASTDHGSSGGALLNAHGEAIGITSAGMSTNLGANLNFAISTELIRERLGWK